MPEVDELIQTVTTSSEPSYRRRDAARSLGKLGDRSAVQPLASVLADKDRYVCRAAVEALGRIADAEAVGPLTKLMADPNAEVRRETAIALGDIGDASAYDALTAALEDSSYSVKTAVRSALAKIGTPADEAKASAQKGSAFVDVPKLMKDALAGTEIKRSKQGRRYTLTVPLEGGRKQKVTVAFDARDREGSHLITIHSVCCPADPKAYERALHINAKLPYGAVALATVKGEDHFVLVDTQLARTAQAKEIRKSVMTVARKADAIEEWLTSEDVM